MRIQVWIEVRKGGIWHIIHIEELKQVIHELAFGFLRSRRLVLSRWRPTLDELSLFSVYLKFLRKLCEIEIYAAQEQVDRLVNEDRLTVFDILFQKEYGIYGQQSKDLNLGEEVEVLGEIVTRPVKKTYLKITDTHIFSAQART